MSLKILLVDDQVEAAEKHFGSGGDQHLLLMRGLMESGPRALLLLTTCEIRRELCF